MSLESMLKPRYRSGTMSNTRSPRQANRGGFTLVELLVVIGIIALLISILLPSLQAARRQAESVKCLADLREIGNAFHMYAVDSKGWYPPNQLNTVGPSTVYNVDGTDFPQQGLGAYWWNFLAKYVTKTKLGYTASTIQDRTLGRTNVFWGCPAWTGYQSGGYTGGINPNHPGYGMNAWPTQAPDSPAPAPSPAGNHPPVKERCFIQNWNSPSQVGSFIRQNTWGKNGAMKCLIADSLFWEAEAENVYPNASALKGQAMAINTAAAGNAAFADGNTLIDCYRHGKYPPAAGDGATLKLTGGKPSFNILYADGHAANSTDRTQAFRACRLRFPY
jgi:prepilin-type N-terminal cleavage/methylation domain-containing protein/prepilin-type processing-associated H-X9-DG protein